MDHASGADFMINRLTEDSSQDTLNNEIVSFFRNDAIGDKHADPFQ